MSILDDELEIDIPENDTQEIDIEDREVLENALYNMDDILAKGLSRARKQRERKSFFTQILFVLLAVYLLLIVFFGIIPVYNDEMKPALNKGDISIIWRPKGSYTDGDIVLVKEESSERTFRRIIAVPGETVEINDTSVVLGENEYLAAGDNEEYDTEVILKAKSIAGKSLISIHFGK